MAALLCTERAKLGEAVEEVVKKLDFPLLSPPNPLTINKKYATITSNAVMKKQSVETLQRARIW
jgi:hypothetical protein